MKFNVMSCDEMKFQDKKTNENRVMYKITGFANSLDITNGLMQFYNATPVDVNSEYNCKLTVSSDMKTLKIKFENKVEGSKGIFNK